MLAFSLLAQLLEREQNRKECAQNFVSFSSNFQFVFLRLQFNGYINTNYKSKQWDRSWWELMASRLLKTHLSNVQQTYLPILQIIFPVGCGSSLLVTVGGRRARPENWLAWRSGGTVPFGANNCWMGKMRKAPVLESCPWLNEPTDLELFRL